MPRPWRLEYAGALYHTLSRGLMALAVKLRQETTLTIEPIARRLDLGNGHCPFRFGLSDGNWMSLLRPEPGRRWPWLVRARQAGSAHLDL